MGEHIQSQRYDIYVSGALSVSEEGAFDPVSSGQDGKFCVCDACSSVVVRMNGKDDAFPAVEVIAHVFYLIGKYMGHRHLHCGREVDNDLVIGSRLPDVDDRVADIEGEFRLGPRKTFGRVLKREVRFGRSFFVFVHQKSAVYGDLFYLFFRCSEDLFSLGERGGVVKMDYSVFYAFERLKGPFDDMLSRLGKHLDKYAIGD